MRHCYRHGSRLYGPTSFLHRDESCQVRSLRVTDNASGQVYVAGEPISSLELPSAQGVRLTYTLAPNVPGLGSVPESRILDGSPSTADSYAMSYRAVSTEASDDTALTFTITVQESLSTVNRPRVVSAALSSLSTTAGDSASTALANHFIDPDGDELECAASSDTATVAVDADMLPVHGVAVGQALVLVIASDLAGASVHQAFTVTVAPDLEVSSVNMNLKRHALSEAWPAMEPRRSRTFETISRSTAFESLSY